MKMAFVAYDFGEYAVRHVNELASAGAVLLVIPEQLIADYRRELDPRVQLHTFVKPRLRQPARQMWNALQLVRAIRRFDPDVVHFQNGHLYFNFALAWLRRYPLVLTIHDARQHVGDHESQQTPQWIMDLGFRRADQVIVHGRSVKATLVEQLGWEPTQVHYIPHVAVGLPRQAAEISDDQSKILFFGRIWEYKGLEYLIRAAPHVLAEFPQAKFVIAGRGEDLQRYYTLMQSRESFEVHNNWISDAHRSELFATASLVVLPYIEASQSGVIPIAYAYEKPVVATRVGGLPDMVDTGRTGLLVPPRDAEALARAICQLLRDPSHRRQLGQAGKRKLLQECSPSVVAQQTLAVYRQAIQQRQPGSSTSASPKVPVQT